MGVRPPNTAKDKNRFCNMREKLFSVHSFMGCCGGRNDDFSLKENISAFVLGTQSNFVGAAAFAVFGYYNIYRRISLYIEEATLIQYILK